MLRGVIPQRLCAAPSENAVWASCAEGAHRRSATGKIENLAVGFVLSNRTRGTELAYEVIGLDMTLNGAWGEEAPGAARRGVLPMGEILTVAECRVSLAASEPGLSLCGRVQGAFRIRAQGRFLACASRIYTVDMAIFFGIDAGGQPSVFSWALL